ncbi:MAG: OmpA family protein [bacterium]|nr:OmpA family protein [bacterium]
MARITIRQRIGVVAVGALMVGSGCTEAEQLIEEQTGGTLDLSEIDLSKVTIPDLNDPDFTLPDLVAPEFVAPEININIDDLIIEAPDLPVIRFPDAVIIEIREITSHAVTVAETPDETIYTIDGQVMFDFDRADLRPEAIEILEEINDAIAARSFNGTIEVAGHSDSIGTAEYNQGLSERRAAGVALWFRQRVSAEQAIVAIGYGESQPIAPNAKPDGSDDPVGRTQNRRVEIIVNR